MFTAQEGQIYQIDVALGTLPDSRLTLYDSDGFTEAWNDDYDNTEASRIKWAAPSSDEYFLEVKGSFDDTLAHTPCTVWMWQSLPLVAYRGNPRVILHPIRNRVRGFESRHIPLS